MPYSHYRFRLIHLSFQRCLYNIHGDQEVIRVVDEVIAYIKSTGLNYYVGPCETSIEGDYDELMDIVKECQKVAIKAGAKSVSAYVKINYRPEGEVLTIEEKVTTFWKLCS